MGVNLRGVLIVSQIAAKNMIARGVKGAIVNVSSQGSQVGLVDHTSYCTSKGGLDQMTRVMAVELGPKGIRTNCVNPTVVLTDMGKKGEGVRVRGVGVAPRPEASKHSDHGARQSGAWQG